MCRYGNVVKQKLQDIEGVKRRLRERQKQLRQAVRETKTQASALIADLDKGCVRSRTTAPIDTSCSFFWS
jgi:F0F1-type ATP synthase membrane subunit b/b'